MPIVAIEMSRTAKPQSRPPRLNYEQRLLGLALLAGLPAVFVAMLLLWRGHYSQNLQWTVTVLVIVCWLGFASMMRNRVVTPLQTLSNLLAALREGDYSLRLRVSRSDDPLADVMREANALVSIMRAQRLDALEATTLLRKVMEEIDVAIFTFDGEGRLRLINRAGERLLGLPSERSLGLGAQDLGLGKFLQGEPHRILHGPPVSFAGAPSGNVRWGVSRSIFRQSGLPMQLLVVADLSRALREEELQAWQKLVRVLGHEINNSLAPIKSIAGSLESLIQREPRPADWEQDVERSLRIISSRAEALSRFTGAYATLAKLPKPKLGAVEVAAWVERVVALETRLAVQITPGPPVVLRADGDQLDQALINLVRNAADGCIETGGKASVKWSKTGNVLQLVVEDEGPGISNPSNLFVPFFTTKPGGAGIGLVLSRQIVEAHGGSLTLENRTDGPGSQAIVTLPV
ncbi:MAG TPA: ATP-binding protein [Terriglobia bacterium]|nr:ATP-binding protein [Terriglobia bacterium]